MRVGQAQRDVVFSFKRGPQSYASAEVSDAVLPPSGTTTLIAHTDGVASAVRLGGSAKDWPLTLDVGGP